MKASKAANIPNLLKIKHFTPPSIPGEFKFYFLNNQIRIKRISIVNDNLVSFYSILCMFSAFANRQVNQKVINILSLCHLQLKDRPFLKLY